MTSITKTIADCSQTPFSSVNGSTAHRKIAMPTGIRSFALLILLVAFACCGCQSDGPTTRIDYTYDKPIWTDASFEKPASPQK